MKSCLFGWFQSEKATLNKMECIDNTWCIISPCNNYSARLKCRLQFFRQLLVHAGGSLSAVAHS